MDLLTIAKALSADDYVSPTIPFVPPTAVTITPTVVVNGPSISLESNVLTLKNGDTASIKVVVFTNAKEITSFKLHIDFDPELFQVVDADTSTTGVQIPYTNTYFLQVKNEVDNENGTIDFVATASGSAPITDRVVSEFQVKGIALGTGTFTLDQSSSSLIDTNNKDILSAVNSLSVTVGTMTVTTTPSVTVTATASPTSTATPVVTIVKTGLSDNLGGVSSIFLGALLVISGFYLFKKKRHYDLQR